MSFRPVVLVPHFNHGAAIAATVARIRAHGVPVLLVDDGSSSEDRAIVADLAANTPEVTLIQREHNGGKGAAVMTGLRAAGAAGYSHALQIDADGQHDADDIPRFLALGAANPEAVISGQPIYDASIPKSRLYGRYLTHVWVWIETLSFAIADSMCGFRLYPLAPTLRLIEHKRIGRRMDFDTEILVRLYWAGLAVINLPTRVTYPADGLSHFDVLRDNLMISAMHTRLVFALLPRLPGLLARKRRRPAGEAHWSRLSERGSRLGIALLFRTYRLLGRRGFRALLAPVVAWYALSSGRARRASVDFLGRVYERYGPRPGLVRRPGLSSTFHHLFAFAESALDKLAAWTGGLDKPVVLAGADAAEGLLADPRGALVIGAHLGNLELCRALSRERSERRIHAVVYDAHAVKFNDYLRALNPEAAVNLIPVQHIDPGTAMRLRERIEAGDWLVIVGDRTPASENGRTVAVEFLGQPAPFAQGPWVLAHLLECPVNLLFCLDEGDGYRIHLERLAERISLPRAGRDSALRHWAGRFAERLEYHAALAPLQWFNFYDFWHSARERS